MGNSKARILIAEDEAPVAEVMRMALSRQGYQVEVVGDGLEAVARALAEEYDLILMDHRMPGCSGSEAMRRILAAKPEQRMAMVTGTPTDEEFRQEEFRQLVEKRGMHWLIKPFSPRELVEAVQGWLASGESLTDHKTSDRL